MWGKLDHFLLKLKKNPESVVSTTTIKAGIIRDNMILDERAVGYGILF